MLNAVALEVWEAEHIPSGLAVGHRKWW